MDTTEIGQSNNKISRKDLYVGAKINHLTLLERVKIKDRYRWVCECDCANHTIKTINEINILTGHTKSCGCINKLGKQTRRKIPKYNIGDKVENWTIISEMVLPNKRQGYMCQCECGEIKQFDIYQLVDSVGTVCTVCHPTREVKLKETTPNLEEMAGKKYGLLTVLGRDFEKTSEVIASGKRLSVTYLKCRCDCGNEFTTTKGDITHKLKNGKMPHCSSDIHHELDKQLRAPTKGYKNDLTGYTNEDLSVICFDEERSKNSRFTYWLCYCNLCGNYKSIRADVILRPDKIDCGCIKRSKGEVKIEKLLLKNNINFTKQKTFKGLVTEKGYPYKFDFFVNNLYIIEYDGEQHHTEVPVWGGKEGLEERILADNIKNNYCFTNNVPIIRIPYTQYSQLIIDDLLLETSKFVLKNSAEGINDLCI